MSDKTYVHIIALASAGQGMSGGDRIYIELSRQWSKQIPVKLYSTAEGSQMIASQKLSGRYLNVNILGKNKLPGNFVLKYLYKIYLGIRLGFSLNINHKSSIINHLLYSSSDFWMDVFPAVILKIRFQKLKWIATWYQTAPNPLSGYSEKGSGNSQFYRKEKYTLSALLYWLSQLPVKPLINKFADFVIVNNEDERKRFPEMDKKGKVIVLIGAVRLDEINMYKKTLLRTRLRKGEEIYDAVFQGRFHPQKGVVELVDIWRKVVDRIPKAKLAMIGDGPLMKDVRIKIQDLRLEKNVELFGYVFDGPEKYKIFSQSKIVVHPAFYDSGGMASAEAMAFGLPCIGFDLKSYESYYPKGMVKVEFGDIDKFSGAILKLLNNCLYYKKVSNDAIKLINNNWSWESRSGEVLNMIFREK